MLNPEGQERKQPARPVDAEGTLDQVQIGHRRIGRAGRGLEDIAETVQQRRRGGRIGPDRHPLMGIVGKLADIVDAVGLVGMGMGIDHRIDGGDIGVDQLPDHVRPGIDQHAGDAMFAHPLDQQRTAAAAVLRIARVAGAPAVADPRHAAR